jgi:hypothetical protein
MSKILVDRKVLEQALEALGQSETWVPDEGFGMLRREAERKHEAAIAALRAALAQPDQEPVAVREGVHEINGERGSSETTSVAFQYRREQVAKQMAGVYTAFGASHIVDADEALIQRSTQQEPVALWHRSGDGYAPVTVEQSHPPEPLTVDEALAQGWRRFYARTEGCEPKA